MRLLVDYQSRTEKYAEWEAIIANQMWLYMSEGKGHKAARILCKLRMRLR